MITLMVFHEVDDVDHWLASPKRQELFGPRGIKVRTFRDPHGSNRIGLIVETPDLATWHETLLTDEALEAMKYDGVRRDTILELVEG
jgi:antibiotic biosynthesis monooxygenase (ABM) superfamily enzyme